VAINLSRVAHQLLPGLMGVGGRYREVPLELESIFEKKQSFMNTEYYLQTRRVGVAQLKQDGGPIAYDNNAGDRWIYNLTPIAASIGNVWTREAIADGLYKDSFGPQVIGLENSMRTFWNIQAASLFNLANVWNAAVNGDGVSLLNTAHPLAAGDSSLLTGATSWSNTSSVPQQLNETSLLAALTTIPQTFVDEAGIPIDVQAEHLVVGYNNLPVALRLTEADLRPSTAENDPNVIHQILGPISKIVVSRYFTNPYAWFLTTSVHEFYDIQREPYEFDMWVDFDTDNLKMKNYERRGFFCRDPRAVYGQMATS
jgi:hypothetical protein